MKGSIGDFKKKLATLPVQVAAKIATRAAPALTALAQATYAAKENPYGDPWPGTFDLVETGATKANTRFVAVGRILRCVLPTRWARYHARYILPAPSATPPIAWQEAMAEAARLEIGDALE